MPFPPEFLRELGERNRIEDVAAPYEFAQAGKESAGSVSLP